MIFVGMVTGGGGSRLGRGGEIAKPHGRTMRLIENITGRLGDGEMKMLEAKQTILRVASRTKALESASTLQELCLNVDNLILQIFPQASSIILVKRSNNYEPLSLQKIDFDETLLNFSANNSVVRVAGEAEPIERRTIYLPDVPNLERGEIVLGAKFERVDGANLTPRSHHLEIGTLKESGLNFDMISLLKKEVALKSLAVAPILDFYQEPPFGAIVLVGKTGFLNPYVDLVPLRDLADMVGRPLKRYL